MHQFFRGKNIEFESFSNKTGFSWPAIFAGTFVFLAIEATFALLAWAIFGPLPGPVSLSAGAGIWMIILSIIALYFGGKAAAHFSGAARRLDGMYHGLVTFGLSSFSAILIATMVLQGAGFSARAFMNGVSVNAGWLFVTLLLGGIAAGIGGSASPPAAKPQVAVTEERATLRPVA